MHKEHPIPNTPVIKVLKFDGFVIDYLKGGFPKSNDAELMKVQSALLKECGPMASTWAEVIHHNMFSDPNARVNVQGILNII